MNRDLRLRLDPDHVRDFNVLFRFLSRRDIPSLDPKDLTATLGSPRVDVMVLCGNCCVASALHARRFFASGGADYLVLAGGFGHATRPLAANLAIFQGLENFPDGTSEADMLLAFMRLDPAIPLDRVLLDRASLHCGQNAEFGLMAIQEAGINATKLLILQDPLMQCRTHASFERFRNILPGAEFYSWATLVPEIETGPDGEPAFTTASFAYCDMERLLALALGEMMRLTDDANGYGPRGKNYIDPVEIPEESARAYSRLRTCHSHLMAKRSTTN